jgi:hypothetical protein
MVIGHVFKATRKVVEKTVPKGSRIQVDKAVKTAKGIAGSRPVKQVSAYEYEALKAERQRRGRPLKGTGPRGGNTKNDKLVARSTRRTERLKKKSLTKTQREIIGKLPAGKRNYRKQQKRDVVVKGSGVDAQPLNTRKREATLPMPKKYQSMYGPTWASASHPWKNVKPTGPIIAKGWKNVKPTGTITVKDLKPFATDAVKRQQWNKKKKGLGVGAGVIGAGTLGSEPSLSEVNAERYLNKSKKNRWGYW